MRNQYLAARSPQIASTPQATSPRLPRAYATVIVRPRLRMYCRKYKVVKFNGATYADLQKCAAAHFALPWDEIMAKSRKVELVEMRRMIFAAAVELMGAKNPELQAIGGGTFERTTIRHSVELHKDWMRVSPNIDYCKRYAVWLKVLTESLSTVTTR